MFRLYSSTKIIRQCQKREWKVNLQLNMSHCEAISQSAVKEVTATYFIFAEIKFGFTVKRKKMLFGNFFGENFPKYIFGRFKREKIKIHKLFPSKI